jgi:serine/threonine protein kinase
MSLAKVRHAEPIPGYRLLERLGSGGFGEVWKCEAPGGLCKAIKFVYGNLNGLEAGGRQAEEELRAVEHIKAIRHPFLLSMDRVEVVGGELLIVTELADKSLHDLFEERRRAGLPGIPRGELLGYLREAAEVLDLLNGAHGLQHLDIKPHNLFVVSGHVKVADFGLVSSLAAGGRIELGAITPLYASPEVFLGQISPRSDQYSLAVVYQELLTGALPFPGKNVRQLLLQHTKEEPDLSYLPAADRHVVARALAKDPQQRFATCQDFARALRTADRGASRGRHRPGGDTDTDLDLPIILAAATPPKPPEADTDKSLSVTPPGRPAPARTSPPAVAALAGHRFLECLGSSPLMDVWKAQAPDGRPRLVRFLYGVTADGRRLEEAVGRFRLLQHPALPQREVVQCESGRLVLVSDLIEESLRDRFQQGQSPSQAGVARDELLGYLRAAAEALDYLYQQHSVQHLGLNPRSLQLEHGRPLLADFGLAQLFWLSAGQPVAQRNARYSAPELFEGTVSPACDQFSLAVIYHELLTGRHAFRGQSARGTGPGGSAGPVLESLPAHDQDVIARALHPDPRQRWPGCTDLVRALAGDKLGGLSGDGFSQRLRTSARKAASAGAPPAAAGSPLGELIGRLVASAGGTAQAPAEQPVLSAAENLLRHTFTAGVPLGTARLRLDAFRQECHGQLIREDETLYVFHVSLPARFWRQWIGRQPGLEVQVGLVRQHALAATPIEVTVQVRPFRCGQARGTRLLEDMGTSLLEGLRSALVVHAEKRIQERLLWPHPLQVRALHADGSVGDAVLCRGKDISLSGIGFYLPHDLPTADVCVELPATPQTPALAVPATLVRAKRCADGWYEVGALFRLVALRKSLPHICLS